ncbi:MAG TPA: arabinofuranosidase catalytic domain-containing protein [Polyangiaceae bacterium]|nr:arabinofuranosidase catalytic domain-containing protein [Polyangiaceae bacterium]
MASLSIAVACSTKSNSDTHTSSGGSSSSGASSASGGSTTSTGGEGGGACHGVTACGGDVVGTWMVTSSCLRVSGQLDLSATSVGCASAPVSGDLQVSGTWTATSNGTYSDNTTTSGKVQLSLAPACLMLSGTTTSCDRLAGVLKDALGYASLVCTDATGGGCTCAATVQQNGGPGIVAFEPAKDGNYKVSDNVLTMADQKQYPYCVAGNRLTLTPQSPTVTGSIELQKMDGAGGGGGGGQGGAAGAGGTANGGTAGTSAGSGGSGGSTLGPPGPPTCDIYGAANTPCVAAYGTVRSLSSAYAGPLYQLRKGGTKTGTGGTTMDIGVVDGFANVAAHEAFCGAETCTFSKLYDQSGKGNDLTVAPAGCYMGTASEDDYESNAMKRAVMVNGHKIYALYMEKHEGYRNNKTTGMPTGSAAQGIYEVVDGKRFGADCCWDFGNASTNNCYGGTGLMNTVFFGIGLWGKGANNGPWFEADFEAGVWSGGTGADPTKITNTMNPAIDFDYAFGLVKTNATNYAIRVANAQSGNLITAYDGGLPTNLHWAMQGGIVLGIGGDNSNRSWGTFFEGAITAGRPSDATDASVLQSVQATGFGK